MSMSTMPSNRDRISVPNVVSREIAARTWTAEDGPSVLKALAADRAVTVRYLVAANRHTPQRLLNRLANDPNAMVAWAARRRENSSPNYPHVPFAVPVDILRNWLVTDSVELLYRLSLLGLLEIRADGTVWQAAKLRLHRELRECSIVACVPKRADKPARSTKAYMQVCLMVAHAFICAFTHRLVYRKFKGIVPSGYSVHHVDENHLNNRPENLQMMDSRRHTSLHSRGKRYAAVLTVNQVLRIRRLGRTGMRQVDIAREFGVAQGTVSKIVRGKRWGNVEEEG